MVVGVLVEVVVNQAASLPAFVGRLEVGVQLEGKEVLLTAFRCCLLATFVAVRIALVPELTPP